MSLLYDMRVYDSILGAIGWTPLVRLDRLSKFFNLESTLYAKLELLNPGGSVKDRIAAYMLEGGEREGKIVQGGVVIEPTSGNTGIGLTLAANVKGYLVVLVMPRKMSLEKELLLRSLGALVVRTPTEAPPDSPLSYYKVAEAIRDIVWSKKGPVSRSELEDIVRYIQRLVDEGRTDKLEEILNAKVEETPYAFIPNQYFNPYNPIAHYETTAREIWLQTNGRIDYFFAGIGTGGTITGVGRYLKERRKVKVIGVDPEGSIFHLLKRGVELEEAKKMVHPYMVEGIGEDLIPGTVDLDVIDDIVVVNDQEAFSMARLLARLEGILAGGSSGAALYAAIKYLKQAGVKGRTAVVILPDTGRNYLSKIFNDEWMRENGFEIDDEKVLEALRG